MQGANRLIKDVILPVPIFHRGGIEGLGKQQGNAEGSVGTEVGFEQVVYQYFIPADPSP